MNPQEMVEARQTFVINYMSQMAALGDQLENLIKCDNVVNRVFERFLQNNDIDIESKIYFKRFNMAKKIIRSPELLFDLDFINDFLDICPPNYWRESLETEFTLYSPQEFNGLDLLREFRDLSFNQVVLTTGYERFCNEISLISDRIVELLHEVFTSINRR